MAIKRPMKKDCPIMLGLDVEKTKGLSVHLFPMVSVSLGSPAQQKDFGVPISFMKGRLEASQLCEAHCCQDIVCFLLSFFLIQCNVVENASC